MYTVVEIKGHQYKLSAGDLIDVERIEAEVGATLTFDQVLLVGGTKTIVGAPVVGGAARRSQPRRRIPASRAIRTR